MKLFGLVLLAVCAIACDGRAAKNTPPQFKNCGVGELFADCTTAKCTPAKGPSGSTIYNCTCSVQTGAPPYMKKPLPQSGVSDPPGCLDPTAAADGKPGTAQSRYSPVAQTGLCNNDDRVWAQCLGVVCTVAADGKTASCPCTSATSANSGGGPYVIVIPEGGDTKYHGQCTDKTIYSSATFESDVKEISEALGFAKPKVLWNEIAPLGSKTAPASGSGDGRKP
jgi:hypothetical protein